MLNIHGLSIHKLLNTILIRMNTKCCWKKKQLFVYVLQTVEADR